MKDEEFDKFMRKQLREVYPSPKRVNVRLLEKWRENRNFKLINLAFNILLVLEGFLSLAIGVKLVGNLFLKVFLIVFGIIVFQVSVLMYVLVNKEEVF